MTRQELRDELKESEGNPEVKARVRQVARQMSQRRMMEAVPTADVIVTNPTHYAVALKYERGDNAPLCVAKGVDGIALKIREVAEAHNVPVVENPPLARALHASVEIDQEVPAEHYRAVAEVMGFRFRGFPAWWLRRTYYLFQMPRWDRRFRIVLDWTVALFFRHDVTKVDLAVEQEQGLEGTGLYAVYAVRPEAVAAEPAAEAAPARGWSTPSALTRDLRERRKAPLFLIRRGMLLARREPLIVARLTDAGCRPVRVRAARRMLASAR